MRSNALPIRWWMRSYREPPSNEEPPGLCLDGLVTFTTLYHQHFKSVYRYFYHQIGHAQDEEDLTARTCIDSVVPVRAVSARTRQFPKVALRSGAELPARAPATPRHGGAVAMDVLDSQPLPEWQVLSAERAQALQGAIRRLPLDQREALALYTPRPRSGREAVAPSP